VWPNSQNTLHGTAKPIDAGMSRMSSFDQPDKRPSKSEQDRHSPQLSKPRLDECGTVGDHEAMEPDSRSMAA
jgi:hypothetical protein